MKRDRVSMFIDLLMDAELGETVVYHTGVLSRDRQKSPILDRLARVVMKACELELCTSTMTRSTNTGDRWTYRAHRAGRSLRDYGPAALDVIRRKLEAVK